MADRYAYMLSEYDEHGAENVVITFDRQLFPAGKFPPRRGQTTGQFRHDLADLHARPGERSRPLT